MNRPLHPALRVPRKPRTCIWEITGACNLRCLHCSNVWGSRHPRELTLDELLRVADSLAALECRFVDLTGGEPLLHPEWDRLCLHLKNLGIKVALITNGTLLDERNLERAVAAGVAHIGVSVDGLQETHDRIRCPAGGASSPWDRTVAAIERTIGVLPVTVISQVNRLNLAELPSLRDFIAELGVKRWQIQLTVPVGRIRELSEPFVIEPAQLESLADFIVDAMEQEDGPALLTSDTIGYFTEREPRLRKRPEGQGIWVGCIAGLRSVAITYDGLVRGCSILPADFDAGDLHDESLETIWNDADRFAFSTRFDPKELTGPCGDCKFGGLCRAGCTSMAYWVTGTIYENPYCLYRLQRERRGCAGAGQVARKCDT